MPKNNPKWVAKPLEDHMTPRKCCICLEPATHQKFKHDIFSQKLDLSSRRFVCNSH